MVGAALASPVCPVVRKSVRRRDASIGLSFGTSDVLEVDSSYCSYPSTLGISCKGQTAADGVTGAHSDDDSEISVWRNGSVVQYLSSDEMHLKRSLETQLAEADSIRKARELLVDLGENRRSLAFPVVWTSLHAFVFLPRQRTKGIDPEEELACYETFPF